jgi:hypothetical protein
MSEKPALTAKKAPSLKNKLQRNFATQNCATLRQQATGNRQQATGNRQQATGNRQQATLYTPSK